MSSSLRRLATFILLLTVPLRVYAAAAMMFCGPANDVAQVESLAPAHHHEAKALTRAHEAAIALVLSVHESAATDSHSGNPDTHSFHDHASRAACCCAGMIAVASFDWKPQAFTTPAISSFIATTVPNTVPHRLERPPRTIFA
jgi:hypothetical protein